MQQATFEEGCRRVTAVLIGDQVKVATLLPEIFIFKTKALMLSPSPFPSTGNTAQLTIK